MVYEAKFFRPRETWREAWVACDGTQVDYDLGCESGFLMLCRLLRHAGKPDGAIVFTEVGVRPEYALVFEFESMHQLAAAPLTHVPLLSQDMYDALCRIESDAAAWPTINDRDALIARDLIELHGNAVIVSEIGQQAKRLFEGHEDEKEVIIKTRSPDALISKSIHTTLVSLRDDPTLFGGLHHRTKAAIQDSYFVNPDGTLTDAAVAAIEAFENAPEKAAPVKRTRSIVLTPQQAKGFDVVSKMAYQWPQLPARTRNVFIRSGWVTIDEDGFPEFTESGYEVYETALRPSEY